jgi:FtsH-binding integral membrane protein
MNKLLRLTPPLFVLSVFILLCWILIKFFIAVIAGIYAFFINLSNQEWAAIFYYFIMVVILFILMFLYDTRKISRMEKFRKDK